MNKRNVLILAENLLDLSTNQKADKRIVANTNNLLNAISDFPTEVDDPTDYINLLKEEIGEILTYDKINNYLKKLDLSRDAWKAESLSEALLMFEGNKTTTLDDLIIEITNAYNLTTKANIYTHYHKRESDLSDM